MNNLFALLLFTMFLGLSSCKNSTSAGESEQKSQAQAGFERLPDPILRRLWNEVELLDFIFHDLPFSMSQSEKPSIQANLTYIGKEAQATIPEGCKPAARQFYQIKGEIEVEADVYFSEGCRFYVFYVDGKAQYANQMSPEGINFFKTMIGKAMDAAKGATGG